MLQQRALIRTTRRGGRSSRARITETQQIDFHIASSALPYSRSTSMMASDDPSSCET